MATYRMPSRKYKKTLLKPAMNIEFVLTHPILELGVVGIAKKFLVSSNYLIQKKI